MSHSEEPSTRTTAADDTVSSAVPSAHPQVVNPDGSPVSRTPSSGRDASPRDTPDPEPTEKTEETDAEDVVGQVEEPAKVMRIGGMIKKLLEEVRDAPLDDAARSRLAEVHERSIEELEGGLSPDLVDELHRITLPFTDKDTVSDAELRVAQAQLVGWLEGLFHGIQTTLVAQQMAAQAQLTGMRRALPPGAHAAGGPFPGQPQEGGRPDGGPGQYL